MECFLENDIQRLNVKANISGILLFLTCGTSLSIPHGDPTSPETLGILFALIGLLGAHSSFFRESFMRAIAASIAINIFSFVFILEALWRINQTKYLSVYSGPLLIMSSSGFLLSSVSAIALLGIKKIFKKGGA